MSFKNQIAHDISNVFLNCEDFGEAHIIEGTQVKCILNSDSVSPVKDGRILGQVEADFVLFGRTCELPRERGPESILNVDGKELIVVKWSAAMGMTEIALRCNLMM